MLTHLPEDRKKQKGTRIPVKISESNSKFDAIRQGEK